MLLESELELLVDEHGLHKVLTALESMAHGKAEHLRSTWQDETAAKSWDRAARTLDTAASHPSISEVSP